MRQNLGPPQRVGNPRRFARQGVNYVCAQRTQELHPPSDRLPIPTGGQNVSGYNAIVKTVEVQSCPRVTSRLKPIRPRSSALRMSGHPREIQQPLVCGTGVAELGLSRTSDEELLEAARAHGRLLVTRERGFSRMVFLNRLRAGVLYLRMSPSTRASVRSELDDVLKTLGETRLSQAFVVIEPSGHRVRRLSTD